MIGVAGPNVAETSFVRLADRSVSVLDTSPDWVVDRASLKSVHSVSVSVDPAEM